MSTGFPGPACLVGHCHICRPKVPEALKTNEIFLKSTTDFQNQFWPKISCSGCGGDAIDRGVPVPLTTHSQCVNFLNITPQNSVSDSLTAWATSVEDAAKKAQILSDANFCLIRAKFIDGCTSDWLAQMGPAVFETKSFEELHKLCAQVSNTEPVTPRFYCLACQKSKSIQNHPPTMCTREFCRSRTKNCGLHNNKVFELYCTDCKCLVCRTCYVMSHINHSVSTVPEAAQKLRDQLLDLINDCKGANEGKNQSEQRFSGLISSRFDSRSNSRLCSRTL